jgi:DNA-directed RNA polymerase specialized sigma24 family protein
LERESVRDMRRALQRVPEPQRRLLILAADGLSTAQLGALHGDATAGAIRTRLHRARRQLLSEMHGMSGSA